MCSTSFPLPLDEVLPCLGELESRHYHSRCKTLRLCAHHLVGTPSSPLPIRKKLVTGAYLPGGFWRGHMRTSVQSHCIVPRSSFLGRPKPIRPCSRDTTRRPTYCRLFVCASCTVSSNCHCTPCRHCRSPLGGLTGKRERKAAQMETQAGAKVASGAVVPRIVCRLRA